MAVGIDVGGDRLHVVGLGDTGEVILSAARSPHDRGAVGELLDALVPGTPVAIDGPGGLSEGRYADDPTVSRKFRTARGCEIALGRHRGIWVPWTTPMAGAPIAAWMAVSIELHELVRAAGHRALETYPHAVFRTLAGARLPTKASPVGLAARVAALTASGVRAPHLAMWSHDALDAAACAVVALRCRTGDAVELGDERDGTSIWLPA